MLAEEIFSLVTRFLLIAKFSIPVVELPCFKLKILSLNFTRISSGTYPISLFEVLFKDFH